MKLTSLLLAVTLGLSSAAFAADGKKADAPAQSLFDGKTLKGWKITDFAGGGSVEVKDGQMIVDMGESLSGVTWTNDVPRMNFELSLEAMRLNGSDFMCGLTFPVGTNCCTFVLGGWGGAVVGISSIDGMDASENDTTKYMKFDKNKWYKVRVRVTPEKIQGWIDDELLADVETKGRRIDMRAGDIESSQPLGLATYQTSSAFRNIQLRKLDAPAPPKK
ncbi:MAG: family 16 glycoside hydrolase [Verrucomicrobiota bacterium]